MNSRHSLSGFVWVTASALALLSLLSACGGGGGGGGGGDGRARAWGAATRIEAGAGDVSMIQVAADAAGNAMAVWTQDAEGEQRGDVWASRYVAGAGWGAPELIETDDSGSALTPRVASDEQGRVVAVWMQYDGIRYNIVSNRYTPGAGWGTAQAVESNDTEAEEPAIAMDRSGNAIVVWSQFDGTSWGIWANEYSNGAWGTAKNIESDGAGHGDQPDIAFGTDGSAFAVWRRSSPAGTVWANRYVAGAGWGKATPIVHTTDSASEPQVAVDAKGNAHVVWQHFQKGIMTNRYDAVAGAWGMEQVLDSSVGGYDAAIVADANGNATAAWVQSNGVGGRVKVNHFTAGTGWGTSLDIVGDGTHMTRSPALAGFADGGAVAVWDELDENSVYHLKASRFTPAAGWSAPETVAEGPQPIKFPALSAAANGNLAAVWLGVDTVHQDAWASIYE